MVSSWTFASVCIASAILFVFYFVNRMRDLPPGPWGLPFLGYLPWIDTKNPHLTFTRLAEKYGGIYSLRLGSVFAVVLSDAGLVRETLAKSEFSGRAPLYLTHGVMNGNGIICAQEEKWREQRKFVTSHLRSFGIVKLGHTRSKIESDLKKGLGCLLEMMEKSTEPIDTESVLMHFLGNVVFELVFGKTWNEEDETWKRLIGYQEEGTKLIGVAGPINFIPILRFLPKYGNVLNYIKNGIRDTHNIYEGILNEYRKSPLEEPQHFLGAFEREMNRRGNNPGYYTLTQFNYLMADLWGAGVDTTMTTLRWFFLYMAKYRHFQEETQKEMDQVVGERDLCLDDYSVLPLLRATLCETQRIRSVTPLGFPHGALKDGFVAGYRIPKGSMLIPLQWAIHMNPSAHPDPEEFNPRRFVEENGQFRMMEDFLPFQTGKRVCLGEELAKMIMFLFGGGVLKKFTLSLSEESSTEGEVGITLTPKRHKIKFEPRRETFQGI